MATTGKSPTRTAFLQDLFQKTPEVSEKEAAGAWQAAGHEGTISPSSYYNVKKAVSSGAGAASERSKAKATRGRKPKRAGRPASTAPSGVAKEASAGSVARRSGAADREQVLDRVEDGIDDLIIELKHLGGMDQALESLRQVRRAVVRSHEG